ncbi:hypothetical protein DFH08DRAFT_1029127 [Mycena albidolilacea]|uniref:Uncharacterized protein n=1 Tax=Mycena albidolilacea TaxID=1033008 RepID=A0AAD7EI59_9AGAR|nr:hypothetical protein DFH08DRAFT_1029127 [Mycena albidolilacea]
MTRSLDPTDAAMNTARNGGSVRALSPSPSLSESKPSAACHGNCCVYFAPKTDHKPDREQTRRNAMELFGCADMSVNKFTAMVFTEQAYGLCISNGNGCGDCFGYSFLGRLVKMGDVLTDDRDFSGRCSTC